jgi:hypothetical protein
MAGLLGAVTSIIPGAGSIPGVGASTSIFTGILGAITKIIQSAVPLVDIFMELLIIGVKMTKISVFSSIGVGVIYLVFKSWEAIEEY